MSDPVCVTNLSAHTFVQKRNNGTDVYLQWSFVAPNFYTFFLQFLSVHTNLCTHIHIFMC
jgi:hypothetical protein